MVRWLGEILCHRSGWPALQKPSWVTDVSDAHIRYMMIAILFCMSTTISCYSRRLSTISPSNSLAVWQTIPGTPLAGRAFPGAETDPQLLSPTDLDPWHLLRPAHWAQSSVADSTRRRNAQNQVDKEYYIPTWRFNNYLGL